jgi:hypothetical protein
VCLLASDCTRYTHTKNRRFGLLLQLLVPLSLRCFLLLLLDLLQQYPFPVNSNMCARSTNVKCKTYMSKMYRCTHTSTLSNVKHIHNMYIHTYMQMYVHYVRTYVLRTYVCLLCTYVCMYVRMISMYICCVHTCSMWTVHTSRHTYTMHT